MKLVPVLARKFADARKISALYDAALAESDLTITQHALLVNVARRGAIGRTALATVLGMDRTTLTRNPQPVFASYAKATRCGMPLHRAF